MIVLSNHETGFNLSTCMAIAYGRNMEQQAMNWLDLRPMLEIL